MSTICAIATPLAVGGISVIRISGDKAISIASQIFSTSSQVNVEKMEGYTCCYGKIISDGEEIDDGILTVFRAPKSFTGEDVCEISCHGGIFVTKKVLSAVIKNGAVPAQAGEFSKRAFLNGKMSLTQAEAVMDVISAQGEQALRVAVSAHEGALFKNIRSISKKLISILSELAAWVDYPEEDLPDIEFSTFSASLVEIIGELEKLLSSYDTGRIIREGVDTAIVGKPNVGKSTLMNLLLGFERSIVTDIKGTTRDIVEETAKVGEVVLKLSDTAGIRTTDDYVEGIGVSLAKKKITQADLVLAVFDNSQAIDDEDIEVIKSLDRKKSIAVLNKSDLGASLDRNKLSEYFEYIVEISARDNSSIDILKDIIENIFMLSKIDTASAIVANERQKQCVMNALEYLKEGQRSLLSGATYDGVTVMLNKATEILLELTGERATDAVVNEVFSRFCVGK